MAGAGEMRALRRRISSVKSTQKVTRAMELIAASRIARARSMVEDARPYAEMITRVMRDLATESTIADHPLLAPRETTEAVGIIVISSDRGLAGAYNTNIVRRAERLMREQRKAGADLFLYIVGRKAETYFRYQDQPLEQVWTGMSDKPRYADAVTIGNVVTGDYEDGKIDRVSVAYTDFRSALNQVPSVAKLLPVDPKAFAGGTEFPPQFLFEPDPATILSRLVPRYVEHRLYAALLESAASEHASRQRAMKAATDNAEEMVEDLSREANRARQAAVTTEITEITGGAEALSSG